MPNIKVPSTTVRDVKFDELDPETIAQVRPEDIAVLRAEWFPREANAIGDGPPIKIDGKSVGSCGAAVRDWAERMTARHGPLIKTWQTPLPWLAALAVVIYGEAPKNIIGGKWVRVWPEEWSPADVERALAWESGAKVPAAVTGRGVIGAGPSVVATLS